MHWIEQAPLLLIAVTLLALLIVAQQLGVAARRLMAWRLAPAIETEDVGHMLSAVLALLGLLLAFTFTQASSRYDARRFLVLNEANAISTTYLRVQTLEPGPRGRLSRQIALYAAARREFFNAGGDAARLDRAEHHTQVLSRAIWSETIAALVAQPSATVNPSVLQTTNEMFDLAEASRAALDARVPITIIRTLLIYTGVTAILIGCVLGSGRLHLVVSTVLFLVMALTITLILDLDRPGTGRINISRAPIDRAIASIREMQAEAPGETRMLALRTDPLEAPVR